MPLAASGWGCKACLQWSNAKQNQCVNNACRQRIPGRHKSRERTDDMRRSESPRATGSRRSASQSRWRCCVCGYSNAHSVTLCVSNMCNKVPDKPNSPHFGNPPQRRTKRLPDLIKEEAEKEKSKTSNPPRSTATPMDLGDAGDMTDTDPTNVANRIALNASLNALDSKLTQLKAIPDPDPDILKAIEERQTKRVQLLADIWSAKPLSVQLSSNLRAADRCKRKLSKAQDEENDLRTLLNAKHAEATKLSNDLALHEQHSYCTRCRPRSPSKDRNKDSRRRDQRQPPTRSSTRPTRPRCTTKLLSARRS